MSLRSHAAAAAAEQLGQEIRDAEFVAATAIERHGNEVYGVGNELSETEFMTRQRYLENSGMESACRHSVSVMSHPVQPSGSSSVDIANFVQAQRKIISNFRMQPWPMQVKMAAIKSYRRNLSKYVPQLNTLDTFRDSSGQMIRRMKRVALKLSNAFTIWGSIIKRIEGNFGTSVGSFFTFLRWLCALNLCLTALVFGLIVTPQALVGHGLEVPLEIRKNTSAVSFIFDGKGYAFEYSVLFYGYYDSGWNETVHPNPEPYIGLFYKLPLAYILVMASLFVVCTVALLLSMAEKYKLIQKANVSEQYPFSWKVFSSWDFAVTVDKAAVSKKKQLTISLKETISEDKKTDHTGINLKFWLIRVATNIGVFLLLAGTSYGIFLAVENAEKTNAIQQRSYTSAFSKGWHGLWIFIRSFQVQMVIVARNTILPFIFTLIAYAEKFHPRTALKLMLIRLFMLYVSSLYVLVIALLTISRQCHGGADNEEYCCWETTVGQELFKLSVTRLLAQTTSIVLIDGGRWAGSKTKKINQWIKPAEFRLADNVLKLVYGQALLLFGVLFCPLLPGISFTCNVLLFYMRAFSVYVFNKPPSTMFRIASTRNFYMGLLLITVFLCALPVGYAMVQMHPSADCGPFRGHGKMLQVVVDEIYTWPRLMITIVQYLETPTVIIPTIALLLIAIYYYAAMSHALKEVNKDLRLQLRVEQNEARERIAKEAIARPVSVPHRHHDLHNVIQSVRQHHSREAEEHGGLGGHPRRPGKTDTSAQRETRLEMTTTHGGWGRTSIPAYSTRQTHTHM